MIGRPRTEMRKRPLESVAELVVLLFVGWALVAALFSGILHRWSWTTAAAAGLAWIPLLMMAHRLRRRRFERQASRGSTWTGPTSA